jgi:hypothetical protein
VAAVRPALAPSVSCAPGVLELLHPDGGGRLTRVIGTGCPEWLSPTHREGAGPVDLAVVAPGPGRPFDAPMWEHQLREAARSLAPDGVLCGFVSPSRRRWMVRMLRASGLELVDALQYDPQTPAGQRLMSLRPAALHRATGRYVPPGATVLLRRLHPRVVLIASRPGARPLLHWLLPAAVPRAAVIGIRRRAGHDSIVVEVLASAGGLLAVAKLGAERGLASDRVVREADLVSRLAPGLRACGVGVAMIGVVRLAGGSPAAVQTPVSGTAADRLFASGRLELRPFAEALLGLLERWNRTTRVSHVCDRRWLEREILDPATVVCARLTQGAEYLQWLHERCAALEGQRVPLVATHGDLTASNVLVSAGGALGLVDWEAAAEHGLPLRDLAYGLVDAAFAADGRENRVHAFSHCFESGGRHREMVRRAQARLQDVLGLSDELATLCLHGCWLQHARDEDLEGPEARPFRGIVQRLASGSTGPGSA